MTVCILEAARDDLIDGFRFYEKSESGLGDYFLTNLYADIESLQLFAGIHGKVYKSVYRALSKRFPFAIYYTLECDSVLVCAVVDCRRKPSWTRKHIKKSNPTTQSSSVVVPGRK